MTDTPNDPIKDLAAALKRAAEATRDAHEAQAQANDAIVDAATALADSVMAAETVRDERGDLRETVHRLEELVLQLATDVRELRARANGKGGAL